MEKSPKGVSDRFVYHSSNNRRDSLFDFKNSVGPKIFVSVNMEEGTDFPDETAR
ncbi:MAG: hypothetical protein QW292_12185 [Candidatus Parvarchaeota archaeon]